MDTPAALWTGRILSGIFALFILGASVTPKLLHLPIAEEIMAQLGWPAGYAFMIGILELILVVLRYVLSIDPDRALRRCIEKPEEVQKG